MDTTQIRCFVAAAESRSFTAAAQKMFVSQATLSRQVASLESELGFSLFERRSNIIALTPAGNIMLEAFREMELQLASAQTHAYSVSRGIIGTLNLGILDGQTPSPLLRKTIMTYFDKYPEIKVNLYSKDYSELTSGLRDGRYDAIVTLKFDLLYQNGIESLDIEPLPTYIVVPFDHPLTKRKNLKLADFKNETFVHPLSTSSYSVTGEGRKTFREHGIKVREIAAPDMRTQLLWLETGFGVACANQYHMLYTSPNLVGLSVPELHDGMLVLAWDKNNQAPTLERLLELFK